jgi:hypothetical protein
VATGRRRGSPVPQDRSETFSEPRELSETVGSATQMAREPRRSCRSHA